MPLRVNVLTPAWVDWDARLLRGIQEYGDQAGGWSVRYVPLPDRMAPRRVQAPSADGLIIMPQTARDAAIMAAVRTPKVFAFRGPTSPGHSVITLDHSAIARMGAEHLLHCRFSRLAFYGAADPSSRERERAFCAVAEAAKAAVALTNLCAPQGPRRRDRQWRPDWAALSAPAAAQRFLRALQPPVGIMCYHDAHAVLLIEQAAALGWHVPDDVAVLGVDDYELDCLYRPVTVSSIDVDIRRMGMEAAKLLHQAIVARLKTSPHPPTHIAVPPRAVVRRMSTDVRASEDQVVRKALGLIRDRVELTSVKQVAAEMGMSRRTLEQRFAATIGQAPGRYMRTVRLERAKGLLLSSTMAVEAIAHQCGFAHAPHLTTAFRAVLGTTPGAFRRSHRDNPSERAYRGPAARPPNPEKTKWSAGATRRHTL